MPPTTYENLLNVLAPHMKLLSDIGGTYEGQAKGDFGLATGGYETALKFYRDIMSGSRSDLLKVLDSGGVTAALDEQQQQNYELGPRGGRRAATAANLEFGKMSELNKMLQAMRGQAPGMIANISQQIGQLGLGKLGASLSGLETVTNLRTGIEYGEQERHQRDADRRSALIGSIFSAAGSVVGGYLGGR